MRNGSMVILALSGMLIMSACSSTSDEPSKSKATSSANTVNSNTVVVTNGTTIAPAQPGDANAAPAASTDEIGLASNGMDARLKAMRKAGEAGADVDPAEVAFKNARPAPDNSTFTSYLTDSGYEIRTFKNHPQLLKVEKKITADGKQSLKIFLRDGKVVELPGQRITILATAPAASILEAAGIKSASPPQRAPEGPPPTKKSGE